MELERIACDAARMAAYTCRLTYAQKQLSLAYAVQHVASIIDVALYQAGYATGVITLPGRRALALFALQEQGYPGSKEEDSRGSGST